MVFFDTLRKCWDNALEEGSMTASFHNIFDSSFAITIPHDTLYTIQLKSVDV
jgi:hypothetical protein